MLLFSSTKNLFLVILKIILFSIDLCSGILYLEKNKRYKREKQGVRESGEETSREQMIDGNREGRDDTTTMARRDRLD